MPETPVNLLWTAGYDSTFRLLGLVDAGERAVRPIYVIDRGRRSWLEELRRMPVLRAMIDDRWPRGRLLPLEVRLRDDFPVAPDIRAAFDAIAASTRIGGQYAWLAQVCRDLGFGDAGVELCMERRNPPTGLQQAVFDDPHGPAPRLTSAAARTLLGGFSFPLLGMTKADMAREAERAGFAAILAQTWFCHRPIFGRPCGRCYPCRVARQERSGIAFSRLGRLRDAGDRALRRLARAGQRQGG